MQVAVKNVELQSSSPERLLGVWQRLALGTGGIPDLGMQYGILALVSPIFNIYLGVSPVFIGIAMALPRFMEMILDPWIGTLSDRTRGRFGPRHPYMVAGGLLGGIIFALLWWVPLGWSVSAKGVWLIVFTLLQFVGFSFFIVPYSALLAEVSSDPLERTRVMAMRTVFTTLCSTLIGWLYWLAQRNSFHDAIHGMRVVGVGFALLMIAGALIPVFVCPESRTLHLGARPPKAESEFGIIKEILRIPEFRGVLFAVLFLSMGFALVATLGFYVQTYFAFGGDTKASSMLQGFATLAGSITGVAICPFIGFLSARIGGWTTLTLFMTISFLSAAGQWWTLYPGHAYFSIITWIFTNWGLAAFWIFAPSITGQICSIYERKTGRSLFGSFFGVFNLCQKVAASLGLMLAGIILNVTGFSVALGPRQHAATFMLMRQFNAFLTALGIFLALCCLLVFVKRAVNLNAQGTETRAL
jgi:GPH family glycoside/pentoside/hexuronide:cation symporter